MHPWGNSPLRPGNLPHLKARAMGDDPGLLGPNEGFLRNDGVDHQLGQPHDIDVQFVVFVQLPELVPAVVTGSHDGLGTGGTDLLGLGLSGLQPDVVVVRQGNQAATAAAADALAPVGCHLAQIFDTGAKDPPGFLEETSISA